MRSIRRILVAVKEPAAERLPAVAKATQLARALGAQLELFHALDSSVYLDLLRTPGTAVPAWEEQRQQLMQLLRRVAARVQLHGVSAEVVAEWDYPAHEAIVRRALASRADLIVADRHAGRHIAAGMRRLADWELLKLSPVPVLLVHRARAYHRPRVLAAVDPACADGKPASLDEEILGTARTVADALRGTLHAVHACPSAPTDLSMVGAAAAVRMHRAENARAVSGFERLLRATHIPGERGHLTQGPPGKVVPEVATEVGSELVVLGAMSRSGLQRILVGNTAERLLDRLRCDLLIVKPPAFVTPVPCGARGVRFVAPQTLG